MVLLWTKALIGLCFLIISIQNLRDSVLLLYIPSDILSQILYLVELVKLKV